MGVLVVKGAVLACSFGSAPGSLKMTSQVTCMAGGNPAATIKDVAANVNITPFGMCSSLANPQVASATAAAMGALTPQPCMPVAMGTWIPVNPGLLAGGVPCLTSDSQMICANGMGVIHIQSPGQTKVLT